MQYALIINCLNDNLLQKLYPSPSHIHVDRLRLPAMADASLDLQIVRFDRLHPLISGNKWYKLQGCLNNHTEIHRIITFGGAWSNHLHATAAFCRIQSLQAIAYVRGEPAIIPSATINDCIQMGMEIRYLNRKEYRQWQEEQHFPIPEAEDRNTLIIPEGGATQSGAKGAAFMYDSIPETATHIIVAAGTGTTAAGILSRIRSDQELIVVPVLKGLIDIEERIKKLSKNSSHGRLSFWMDAHEGGYAKVSEALFSFINEFYRMNQIALDVVYTGKLMNEVYKRVLSGYFPKGSHIACIHSGGLQGNRSVAPGRLTFDFGRIESE